MKNWIPFTLLGWVLCSSPGVCSEWQSVEKILGRSGVAEGEILRVSIPRTDLNVLVSGVSVDPGLATASWFSFKPISGKKALANTPDKVEGEKGTSKKPLKGTLLVGNLVLLDQEVPKVILTLIRHGFQVTDLSHPLLHESPALESLSFTAHGPRSQLAETLREALYHTGTPVSQVSNPLPTVTPPTPEGKPLPASSQVNSAPSKKIWDMVKTRLGAGEEDGGLLKYHFARADAIEEDGEEIPPLMGTAITIQFQQKGKLLAAAGEFVLTTDELEPVMEALSQNRITVTAIHHRLVQESPRLFFLDFWALDVPKDVAGGLKAALKEVDLVPDQLP